MQESMCGRHNAYAQIHKALRAMMGQALIAAGSTDWQDGEDCAQTLGALRMLLEVCAGHLGHENQFIHPAMEARQPGSAGQAQQEHEEHLRAIEKLRGQAALVELLSGEARVAAGEALYRQLAVFVAENYEHMHYEETHNNSVLWAAYSDQELMGIHQALVASLTPEEQALTLRWMLPHMSAQERADMLQGMRAHAPAAVFEANLALARQLLLPRDMAKLERALGLAERAAA